MLGWLIGWLRQLGGARSPERGARSPERGARSAEPHLYRIRCAGCDALGPPAPALVQAEVLAETCGFQQRRLLSGRAYWYCQDCWPELDWADMYMKSHLGG